MKTVLFLYWAFFQLSALAATTLPSEINTFLKPTPKEYEKAFLKPAKQLKKAQEALSSGKRDLALKEFLALTKKTEMAEHAIHELAALYREKKEFAKSTELATRFLYENPYSPYRDEMEDFIQQNDCDLGLQEAKKKSSTAKQTLFRCLSRTPWKKWNERENEATALYTLLKNSKDPLLGPFIGEVLQAMSSSSDLRGKIQRETSEKDLNGFAEIARFRTKSIPAAGVKSINPDQDLFDSAMALVLEKNWSQANEIFKKFLEEFPQSEHIERAQYWVARTEEEKGNKEEANKLYEEIYNSNLLSYYGLQSAIKLKKDLTLLLVPSELKLNSFQGNLLPKQYQSLWRLKALMEVGLIDFARIEAQSLFQFRPGGFTVGQEDPNNALLMAIFYQNAGYSLAAFSHAYAAVTLDPSLLNLLSLEIFFPAEFQKEFEIAAAETEVHPLLLASITKQESAFIPKATSKANAYGLMQLLLGTAKEVNPKADLEKLYTPEENIKMGAKYFQKLLDRYQGNIALALAGYNAGPSRASQWQKKMLEAPAMADKFDVDIFIDTIPFTETRKYVAAILRNYAWYKLLQKDAMISSIEELATQWQKPKEKQELSPQAL
jgi:soluble lytic murein transglycosylase-like protein